MANSEKTAKKSPKTKKWSKMFFFEKTRNFSALDERDCQAAWLFAHWGQFGRETRAWPDGADPPHFHMHIGKIGQFLEVWVFPGTQVEFKLRRGRRRRGYSISDELLRGFNVLGLAEGIISLILHGPGKWRALARKREKKSDAARHVI